MKTQSEQELRVFVQSLMALGPVALAVLLAAYAAVCG